MLWAAAGEPADRPGGLLMLGRFFRVVQGPVPAVCCLLLGLGWLVYSSWTALGLGRDSDIQRRWVDCQYVLAGADPYAISLAVLHRAYGPVEQVKLRDTEIAVIPQNVPGQKELGVRVPP